LEHGRILNDGGEILKSCCRVSRQETIHHRGTETQRNQNTKQDLSKPFSVSLWRKALEDPLPPRQSFAGDAQAIRIQAWRI